MALVASVFSRKISASRSSNRSSSATPKSMRKACNTREESVYALRPTLLPPITIRVCRKHPKLPVSRTVWFWANATKRCGTIHGILFLRAPVFISCKREQVPSLWGRGVQTTAHEPTLASWSLQCDQLFPPPGSADYYNGPSPTSAHIIVPVRKPQAVHRPKSLDGPALKIPK